MPDIFDQLDSVADPQTDIFDSVAAESPSSIDGVKSWLSTAMKFPAKVGMATANLSGTGMFRWPTDQEVETPLVSPEQMKTVMPYAYVADAAKQMFPESKTAQVAAGLTGGLTETASGLTSPENAAMLGIAPEGKLAQRLVAGTFLGQSLLGTPEQWEAFKNAPDLSEKVRIATTMGLGIALPAAGLLHARTGEVPKEKTSSASVNESSLPNETPRAETPFQTETGRFYPQESVPVEQSDLRPQSQDRTAQVVDPLLASKTAGNERTELPQPEPSIPSVEEARPKTIGDVFDQVSGEAPSVLERTEEQVPPPVSQKIGGIKEENPELVRPTGQNEPTPTSTKNAVTEAEREARGIQPAEQTAKREFGTVWDEAEAIASKDADAPRRLVDEIAANPRALTDKENALLLRRQIEVQNEHDAAVKAVNEATDDAGRMDATARLERVRDDLQAVYDAAKAAGTETGRGLNARKMLANDDFSLAKMEATTRAVVNDGKPLTPKQAADVAALHERIKVAERRLAEYETREKFNDLIRDAQKEARARKASGKTHQTFLEERAARARERIKEMPGVCAL